MVQARHLGANPLAMIRVDRRHRQPSGNSRIRQHRAPRVDHQGMAMALFSQCFAVSAFVAPQVAGLFLDQQRHGAGLWLAMAVLCLLGLTLVRPLARVHPHASASGGL